MFYVLDFGDCWRIDAATSSHILPVAGEARQVFLAHYPDRSAAWRAVGRLIDLTAERPADFIFRIH